MREASALNKRVADAILGSDVCLSASRQQLQWKKKLTSSFRMTRPSKCHHFRTPVTLLAATHCPNHDLHVIIWSTGYLLYQFQAIREPDCPFLLRNIKGHIHKKRPRHVRDLFEQAHNLGNKLQTQINSSRQFTLSESVLTLIVHLAWEWRGAIRSADAHFTVALVDWDLWFESDRYQPRE